jgi:cytochrome c553
MCSPELLSPRAGSVKSNGKRDGMPLFPRAPLRKLVAWGLGLAAAAALALLLFAWSGLYSVAASDPHWAVTRWLLDLTLKSSVRTHSFTIDPPALNDSALVQLGAAHFEGGCALCHGMPSGGRNPIVLQMRPEPPDLTRAVDEWETAELFWIVKNGLKYTGMPAWAARERDDEVWAVVAFLKRLPVLAPRDYPEIAFNGMPQRTLSTADIVRAGSTAPGLTACARCHEDANRTTAGPLVPKLAGQKQHYLERALRSYATGGRQSGIMQPIAAALDRSQTTQLARFYATLQPSHAPAPREESAAVARGRAIASEGVAAAGIPPCQACHASGTLSLFPTLTGQHARYIAQQLQLWKRGLRQQTVLGQIMAVIARRLSDAQIADVAAYFAQADAASTTAGGDPAAP